MTRGFQRWGLVLAVLAAGVGPAAGAPVWTAPPVDGANLAAGSGPAAIPGPRRVGHPLAAGLTPARSGVWETASSGDRVWRLTVRSPGALWLVLGFDEFDLPADAALHVLDRAGRGVAGPFTAADRQSGDELWLAPLAGDELTLALEWPARLAAVAPALRLATVSHGFLPVFGIGGETAAPTASAACNQDVQCPLGDPLDDQRRGVVHLLIGGSVQCSGTLINNTNLDCKPYVLAAEHCFQLGGGVVATFNYERPACGGGTAPTTQTIAGASVKAFSAASDFRLLELLQSPVTQGFDVFFNGWSRVGANPTSGWTIHHPEDDPRQIAQDNGPLVNGTTFGAQYWRVNQWEQGTTESGSSGAPLFDQNRRVVGQLRGGPTTPCLASGNFSEFGKLNVSWTGGGSAATRLSDWLDPAGTGAVTLDGMDGSFCGALAPDLDVAGWTVTDAAGNNNGFPEPGERVRIEVAARNGGPLAATGVSGALSSTEPGVAVHDGDAAWPDIAAGQAAVAAAPHFEVEFPTGAACGSAVPFQVGFSSKQGNFTGDLWLALGRDTGLRAAFFSDDMEGGANGWTAQILAGSNPWAQSTADNQSPTHSWRVLDPGSGPHDSVLRLPDLGTLPEGAVLRFSHHMQAQTGFDGGVLELSVDGVNWQDAGPWMLQGGYIGGIGQGASALAGRDAWTGDLGGWLPVEVDLAAFAGQNLRARWRFATDAIGGAVAWAVDDVVLETRVFECEPPLFPYFPGSRCRNPPAGGGIHRPSGCGDARPAPAPH